METYQNTLEVILGSQEKAINQMAWAEKFAAKTPFEIPEIIEATTRLESYGIVSKDVMGITGDMASVMGKDLMQAVEALADAQTGELERLKEFGITKKMIEDQAEAMGKAVTNNKGQITDQEQFNKALFAIMEERFKGGMEMQSQTFKGMISNAQDFMGSFGRELGKPIFEKAKAGMQSFLDFLNHLSDSGAIDRFISKIHSAGSFVSSVFSKAAQLIKAAFTPIMGVLESMVSFFVSNFSTFQPYVIGVATAFLLYFTYLQLVNTWLRIVAAAQFIFNTVMSMNPVVLVVLAIGLLIGALIQLAGGWDTVKQKLLIFWQFLVTTWNSIWATLQPILTFLGQKLVQIWQYLVQVVPPILAQFKTLLLTWFTNIWLAIQPLLTILWTGIVNIFNSLKAFWEQWGGAITAYFSVVWSFVSSIFMSALTVLWTIVQGAFTYIYNIVSGVFKMISGVIQIGWALISGIFSTALSLLTGDWEGAWNNMLDMLSGVWSGIEDFFGGLKDLFFDSGKAIIQTLADGILSVATAPFDAVKSALGTVRNLLPFSDAKTGPLSNLTHNGGKIVTTMAEGVYRQAGVLHKAMTRTLEDTPTSTSGTVAANGYRVNPAGQRSTSGSDRRTQIKNLIEKLVIQGVDKDGKTIADEVIEALYEKLSQADDILSAADMEALLYD
ncbi:tape measure protein [Cytobacillus kochii]|uniref:tape measure protein n=1 Tax=Cytobacillus kochii TaxID=859143 RepID=UPI00402A6731